MRKILFRGKRLSDGKWVYGNLYDFDRLVNSEDDDDLPFMKHMWGIMTIETDDVIDPKTVGQFTGLLDANGEQIFEGDLLRDEDDVWEVKWDDDDAMFILQLDEIAEHFGHLGSEGFEIIGDIHENKEKACENV